jgi:phospholipid/cholesterol/gamma-HCH transport system ATP-binding protein
VVSRIRDLIVRVENLTAGYGEMLVVDNICFEVARGEVFVILGGSGSGKSTILKQMIGLYKPMSGTILINGKDIVSAEGKERLQILSEIGVMYQRGALFGSMTLLENARLPLEEFTDLPLSAMDLIAKMKLELVGLHGFEHQMPSQLSGGMQKRAAMARAMALDPQILFLDEPSSGLDPITSAEVDQLVLNVARNLGITFIIVSHDLASTYTIADRVVILDTTTRGIAATGRPDELRDQSKNPWVRQFLNRKVASDMAE